MPNKHFYFAMGALHGTAVVAWANSRRHIWFEQYRWVRKLYRWDPDWFLYFPVVIALFGCLALVPDTFYALGFLPKSVIRTDLFNMFYGYAWFEYMENTSPRLDWVLNTMGSVLLYVLAMLVLGFYVRLLGVELHQHRVFQNAGEHCQ
jgi:hypothetical protein